jgi:lipopolysaccharide biosynthesis protein
LIDEETPIAPLGGMYWARTAALRKLFSHEWKWSDFAEEPGNYDGTTTHILERMIAYAAQDSGYLSRWVMTPEHAASNYVKLEYKHQRLAAMTPFGMLNDQIDWLNQKLPPKKKMKGDFISHQFHTAADHMLKNYPLVANSIRPIWKSAKKAVSAIGKKPSGVT